MPLGTKIKIALNSCSSQFVPHSSDSETSGSESFSDFEPSGYSSLYTSRPQIHFRRRMTKKKSKNPAISELPDFLLPPGRDLSLPNGLWDESVAYHFVRKHATTQVDHFRDLSRYLNDPNDPDHPCNYSREEMDRRFGERPGTSYEPAVLREEFAGLRPEAVDQCFRATFAIDEAFIWRWPEPGERIYHRPDGFIGVTLEQLRGGWRPRQHHFFKHLCVYCYRISPSQFAPNSIKWVTWFFMACHISDYLPTFRLFNQIFSLKPSTKEPIFELVFRSEECGYLSRRNLPVFMLNSLKGHHSEFIFISGLDLQYMPVFSLNVVRDFPVDVLTGGALMKVHNFCGATGKQLNRNSFMDNRVLVNMNCKSQ